MQIYYVLHAEFEQPGAIEVWALERGFSQLYCRPFAGDPLLPVSAFDALIVMGGPQSAPTLEKWPYLEKEVGLISQAVARGMPVLGFCLGAQLIGHAFGARAERSPHKEIGVFPIDLTEAGQRDSIFHGLPPRFPVAHWHSDMPGLTTESEVLATSLGCPRQVVRYNARTYGFQCHPELMHESMEMMVQHCPEDLAAETYVQSAAQLLGADLRPVNARMRKILDNFFGV